MLPSDDNPDYKNGGVNLYSKRIIVFMVVFSVGSWPVYANHLGVDHETDYAQEQQDLNSANEKEWADYKQELNAAIQALKAKTARIWGDDEVLVPNPKKDVTYRNDFKQRSIVDYEHGTVQVEWAMRPHKASNPVIAKQRMAAAIEQTLLQAPDPRSLVEIAENPDPPASDKPSLLLGLVAGEQGGVLQPQEISNFKYLKTRALSQRVITGNDGSERVVVSTYFKMVPDHIRILAEKFHESVSRYSEEHDIAMPLIFAIMETESFFNPTAKSPVPAFGLMQLVPETGARDAYRFLFARDRILKDAYLYDADNNIQLGVAYLHLLYNRYLNRIKDPRSRQWATIAAYNTGVHNVISSFIGEYTKTKHVNRWLWKQQALNKINRMRPEEVYEYMRKYLPSEETREYIKKIRERMPKYKT